MDEEYSVPLQSLIDEFSFEPVCLPRPASEIYVKTTELNRPGLALSGFFELFEPERIQLIGNAEHCYLAGMDDDERHRHIDAFIDRCPVAVIVTSGIEPFEQLVHQAEKRGVPLLKAKEKTSNLMAALIASLSLSLAPRITRHGVLVEVYGEGCLITGDSGVGKSETAIELIKRGHRLVADDAVEIRRTSKKTLVGTSPENIRHFIELRGIGIINARRIFGMGAIKQSEKIDMVINMEIWDPNRAYDRMGLDSEYTEILGVDVPVTTIPVRPGRNLSMIIEVAAMNNRQKKMGYNAAMELLENLGMSVQEEDFQSIKVDTGLGD